MPVITTSVCCHSLYDRQLKVPTAPRSVRVTNATSTSLHVTWSAPRPSRGPLVAYRVTHWTGSSSPTEANSRSVLVNDVIDPGATITQLTPYTKYYFTVCMMNMKMMMMIIIYILSNTEKKDSASLYKSDSKFRPLSLLPAHSRLSKDN